MAINSRDRPHIDRKSLDGSRTHCPHPSQFHAEPPGGGFSEEIAYALANTQLIAAATAVALLGALPSGASAQPLSAGARPITPIPATPTPTARRISSSQGIQFFGSASRGPGAHRPGGGPSLGRTERLYSRPGSRRARSLAAYAMAKASCSPETPANARFSGKVPPWVSISAAKAPAP